MFATAIFDEPNDVDARLAKLQLDQQVLIDSVLHANLYRVRLTSHHPNLYRYSVLTNETVAALRDLLIPRGWEKCDEGHYELTVNSSLNVGIAVASGNAGTGNRHLNASNKSEKGPRTAKAVDANRTADLFPETLPVPPEAVVSIDTWILLHRLYKNELRMELSRPNGYDESQKFVTSWSERILLRTVSLGDDIDIIPDEQGPDLDIPISRKVA